MVNTIGRHWWAVGVRGLAAIIFGILALLWPGLTLVVLVALFGAYALVDGLFALAATVRAASRHRAWSLLLLEGIVGIVVGILTFAWPGITALVLLYLIAAWALITGILEVGTAFTARAEVAHAWLLGLAGVASVLFGLAMGTASVIIGLRSGSVLLSLAALCGACGTALLAGLPVSAAAGGTDLSGARSNGRLARSRAEAHPVAMATGLVSVSQETGTRLRRRHRMWRRRQA